MKIAIDWDHTLFNPAKNDWMPGATDALWQLLGNKNSVIIHSCRTNWPEGAGFVETKLREHGFTYHKKLSIWTGVGKPEADVYIDDRGLRFETWFDTMAVLRRKGA